MSSNAKRRYVPGTSRNGATVGTFRQQMADVARADQLRALRQAHRLTQPDMAEVAGVTLRAYQAWEREDDPGGIKWERAKRIAKHFDVDPETLVRRRDEDPVLLETQELRETLQRIEAKLDQALDLADNFISVEARVSMLELELRQGPQREPQAPPDTGHTAAPGRRPRRRAQ